jgi:ATP-dependent exoDNAse (exonuclease V) beta subunit
MSFSDAPSDMETMAPQDAPLALAQRRDKVSQLSSATELSAALRAVMQPAQPGELIASCSLEAVSSPIFVFSVT